MVEIIPSINVPTFEEVEERIKKVGPYVNWCHLDVTDGVFSKHPTWRDPSDLPNLWTSQVHEFEVHLMVKDPEKIIDQWLVKSISRVIVHLEAMTDPELIIKKCHDAGIELGFAVNPETSWEEFKPWFGKVDIYQTLAVPPGPSGSPIASNTYDKIIHIRKSCPECIIEVDGGINPETAKKAVKAGANLLVAGNYIFLSPDIKRAIEILRGSTS